MRETVRSPPPGWTVGQHAESLVDFPGDSDRPNEDAGGRGGSLSSERRVREILILCL